MTAQLPNSYQSNFDSSKNYFEPLFFPGQGLAAYEKNDIFKLADNKRKELARLIVKEGDIVDGASPVVNNATGAVRVPAGKIWVKDEIIAYPESTFTIAIDETVKLGVYIVEKLISGGVNVGNDEDPDLLDPSADIDGKIYATSGRETSKRLQNVLTWGWKTDSEASQTTGVFYEVFSVNNGILILPTTVSSRSGIIEEIAIYDRDVNGPYIVEGLDVGFDYEEADTSTYFLNVAPGRANINGYKRSISANTRFELPFDPDLRQVTGDPFVITVGNVEYTETVTRGGTPGTADALGRSDIQSITSVTSLDGLTTYTVTTDYTLVGDTISWAPGGAEPAGAAEYLVTYEFTGATVETDKGPLDEVISVLAPLKITEETVVRGAIADSTDALANTSVVSLIEVKQGATTYTAGVDYQLTGSTVDWSLGGIEPSASSSYTVTYTYNKTIAADVGSLGSTTYTIDNQGAAGDLVNGSTVLTNYNYRLPRIDLLEFTQSGQLRRIKGVSQDARPNAPTNSPDSIGLVEITLDWLNAPTLRKIGNIAIKQGELQGIKNRLYTQGVLLAELQLTLNATLAGASNAGIFTDAFTDTDKTDAGKTQTLKIVDNTLTIPLTLTRGNLDNVNNQSFSTLTAADEVILDQSQKTAAVKINPFATFTAKVPITTDSPIDHQVDDTSDDTIIGVSNPDPIRIVIDPSYPVVIPSNGGTVPDPITPDPVHRLGLTELRDLIKDTKGINKLQPKGKAKTLAIVTKLNAGETLGVVKIGGVLVDTATGEVVKNKKS